MLVSERIEGFFWESATLRRRNSLGENKEVADLFQREHELYNCIPRRGTCTFFTALLRGDYAEFIDTKTAADTMQRCFDVRKYYIYEPVHAFHGLFRVACVYRPYYASCGHSSNLSMRIFPIPCPRRLAVYTLDRNETIEIDKEIWKLAIQRLGWKDARWRLQRCFPSYSLFAVKIENLVRFISSSSSDVTFHRFKIFRNFRDWNERKRILCCLCADVYLLGY